nr:LuxR C-terminal-related transcriptional regulator [Altericroceibacterium endophyticum]
MSEDLTGLEKRGNLAAMMQNPTIHFVDSDSRSRAEHARLAYSLGSHAEVYADCEELCLSRPQSGLILICEDMLGGDVDALFRQLERAEIFLPVVIAAREPNLESVVDAIKGGALYYLQLPLRREQFAAILDQLMEEAEAHLSARRKLIEARQRIAQLSKREKEVLDWLASGCSNKLIARHLSISPRTVEIHRANMMDKLGADHAAKAVRLWLEAELPSAHEEDTDTKEDMQDLRRIG